MHATVPLRTPSVDHAANRDHAARLFSRWVGAIWAGTLLGILLGLDRVPWLEAAIWSIVSGILVWRGVASTTRRSVAWLLGPAELQLSAAPRCLRDALPAAMVRRGFTARRAGHTDIYTPRFLRHWIPPLRVTWNGAGASVLGPRLWVRVAARIAVG